MLVWLLTPAGKKMKVFFFGQSISKVFYGIYASNKQLN